MSKVHLKGINGIRTIAAIGVILSHISITLNVFFPVFNKQNIHIGNSLADYGVTMFFALSGFLITYLLLVEKEIGGIEVVKFYIRRILRIWPLYYSYLFICLALVFIFKLYPYWGNSLFYIFLAGNFAYGIRITVFPLISHFWSIGVEEQFYLFWPWLIKRSSNVMKSLGIFIVAFFFLKIILRFLIFKNPGIFIAPYNILFYTRFDCMAIGAVFACLYKQKSSLLSTITSGTVQVFAWFLMVLVALNRFSVTDIINHEIVALVTSCIIISQITGTNRIINLDNRFFDFLGKISYGLYVIHPLVMFLYFGAAKYFQHNSFVFGIVSYPIVIGLTILFAYISYEYFEKRFLKRKEKYSVVVTAPFISNSNQ